MEDFVTVPMLAAEGDALRAAAAAKGVAVEQYVLAAALERVREDAQEAAGKSELVDRTRAIFGAYQRAMGLTSADLALDKGRVAKGAKVAAKAGRRPEDLEQVVAWLRQVDGRYRNGQRIPIEVIVQQWAAWAQTQAPVRPVVPASDCQGAPVAARAVVFGEIDWDG